MKVFKILLVVCVFIISGCYSDTNSQESKYTEQMKEQSLSIVGLPNITNFFEMAQLKEIYELRDNPDLIMFWYTKNEMSGKWVYEGKCMGYGIPYGASITNPETIIRYQSGLAVPLAEPNGLYTNGVTSSATWILSLDDKGDIQPTYVENSIRVTPYKIRKEIVEEYSLTSDY